MNRDNVVRAERRKANPKLINMFALSIAMPPSSVEKETKMNRMHPSSQPTTDNNNTTTGESRTMQMDDLLEMV